jgi:hypothetical protein
MNERTANPEKNKLNLTVFSVLLSKSVEFKFQLRYLIKLVCFFLDIRWTGHLPIFTRLFINVNYPG